MQSGGPPSRRSASTLALGLWRSRQKRPRCQNLFTHPNPRPPRPQFFSSREGTRDLSIAALRQSPPQSTSLVIRGKKSDSTPAQTWVEMEQGARKIRKLGTEGTWGEARKWEEVPAMLVSQTSPHPSRRSSILAHPSSASSDPAPCAVARQTTNNSTRPDILLIKRRRRVADGRMRKKRRKRRGDLEGPARNQSWSLMTSPRNDRPLELLDSSV